MDGIVPKALNRIYNERAELRNERKTFRCRGNVKGNFIYLNRPFKRYDFAVTASVREPENSLVGPQGFEPWTNGL